LKPPARLKCLPTVPAPVADPRPSSLIDGRNRRKIHIDEDASDKGLNEIDRVWIAISAEVEEVVIEEREHVAGEVRWRSGLDPSDTVRLRSGAVPALSVFSTRPALT